MTSDELQGTAMAEDPDWQDALTNDAEYQRKQEAREDAANVEAQGMDQWDPFDGLESFDAMMGCEDY